MSMVSMTSVADQHGNRAGRWETIGAWLHLWTPRRGVYVRPAPWRAIAIATVVAAGVITAAVILLAAGAGRSNRREATQRKQELTAAAKHERARLKLEQRPHFARIAARPPSRAAQATAVAALESSITRDARDRYRADKLDSRALKTVC